MSRLPGGEVASPPLHFIWICDCGSSTAVDGRIQALNQATRPVAGRQSLDQQAAPVIPPGSPATYSPSPELW